MRVAIAALGTRGDVLPYVVLARGLREAGHDVLISSTESFRGPVEEAGVGFHALPGDPGAASRAVPLDVSPWRPLHHIKVVHAAAGAVTVHTDPEAVAERWADRDYVLVTPGSLFGVAIAQQIGAGFSMVAYTPAVATSAYPHSILVPGLTLGAHGNLASWLVAERLANIPIKEPLRPSARRAWQLPGPVLSRHRQGANWPPLAVIHAYSPAVVPRPADWPAHVTVTGWLLPEISPEPLPEHVDRFLADGPPPIYVGFGSMPVPDRDASSRMLVAAFERTGQRGIVLGADLAATPAVRGSDAVLGLADLPPEQFYGLLNRVRAVVHHGGSGTTGAALRSGKPTLVTPYIFDQFFWGNRVKQLGVGPAPIRFGQLSEPRLARAFAELASGRYDDAAQRLGDRIRAENAAARAVQEIERAAGLA